MFEIKQDSNGIAIEAIPGTRSPKCASLHILWLRVIEQGESLIPSQDASIQDSESNPSSPAMKIAPISRCYFQLLGLYIIVNQVLQYRQAMHPSPDGLEAFVRERSALRGLHLMEGRYRRQLASCQA